MKHEARVFEILLHARNEIEGVFAFNSKYVVCLKKLFAGKGGLYEFIMFYDTRA